jgi:hypothetical protein
VPRLLVALTVAMLAACTTAANSPVAPSDPAQATGQPKAPTDTTASPPGPFTGRLTDGGNWIPGIGDASPQYLAYDVGARYVFVDSSGRDTLRVVKVDSAAYYDAAPRGDTVGALGSRYPPYDCPVPIGTLLLECQPSATVIHVGQYLVTAHDSAGVVGQFELLVYPP